MFPFLLALLAAIQLLPTARAQAVVADVTYPMAPWRLGAADMIPISSTDMLIYRPIDGEHAEVARLGRDLVPIWSTSLAIPKLAMDYALMPVPMIAVGPDFEYVRGATMAEMRVVGDSVRILQSTIDTVQVTTIALDSGTASTSALLPRATDGSTTMAVSAPGNAAIVLLVFADRGPKAVAHFFGANLKELGSVSFELDPGDRASSTVAMDPSGALMLATVASPRAVNFTRFAPKKKPLTGSYLLADGHVSALDLVYAKDGTAWAALFEDTRVGVGTVARAVIGQPGELDALHVLALPPGSAAPQRMSRTDAVAVFAGVPGGVRDHQILHGLTPLDGGGVALVTQYYRLETSIDSKGRMHTREIWARAEVLGFDNKAAFQFHRSVPSMDDADAKALVPMAPVVLAQAEGRLRVVYYAGEDTKIDFGLRKTALMVDDFLPNGAVTAPRRLVDMGRSGGGSAFLPNLTAGFGLDRIVFASRSYSPMSFTLFAGSVDVRLRQVDLSLPRSASIGPVVAAVAPRTGPEWVFGFGVSPEYSSAGGGVSVANTFDARLEGKHGFAEASIGLAVGATSGTQVRAGYSWFLTEGSPRAYAGALAGPQILTSARDLGMSPVGLTAQGGVVFGRGPMTHLDLRGTLGVDYLSGADGAPVGVRGGVSAYLGW